MVKDISEFKKSAASSREKTIASSLDQIKKDDLNIIITVSDAAVAASKGECQCGCGKDSTLCCVPYIVSDNFSTKGIETTCASQIMKGYVPPFEGFAIDRMTEAGAVLLGKANMMEFGILGAGSAYGPMKNPWDKTKKAGPSGGCTAAVSAGEVPVALSSDAGGILRVSASYCGVYGFRPSYGAVSRFGLIYCSGSMDQIGVAATTVADVAAVMETISGHDNRDTTSLPEKMCYKINFEAKEKPLEGVKIGVPEEYLENVNPDVLKAFNEALSVFEKLGAKVSKCTLPSTKYSMAAHDVIFAGESSAMLAKFDGTRFGPRVAADNWHDMIAKTRGLFGPVVQRRIMLGVHLLTVGQYQDYYVKALKTRTVIVSELEKALNEYDFLVCPTTPNTAPPMGEACSAGCAGEMSAFSPAIAGVDLAGLPAISIPCGFAGKMPVGMQLIGSSFKDADVLKAAEAFEKQTDYVKNPEVI
ncbi:Glutamyl-tRNA(Gln) amidotransferase subunit A [Methanosarcinaceae archaeon Ag5]|uniref:Glutamyl-tRNA(Gln) amidotransferase subunit A n=1 Tax=Methanolapillus africanus TaxID=3028297 RepID=A0AAE4MII9_9EURY|nr:Glutamyl-tRNA(Gln) amidotransferase subunit A [Methanosarcinaceae archaeon Ag5]